MDSISDFAEMLNNAFGKSSKVEGNEQFYQDVVAFGYYIWGCGHVRRFFRIEDEGILVYSPDQSNFYQNGCAYIIHDDKLYTLDLRPEIPPTLDKRQEIKVPYSLTLLSWDGSVSGFMEYVAQPQPNTMIYFVRSTQPVPLGAKAEAATKEYLEIIASFLDLKKARQSGMLS